MSIKLVMICFFLLLVFGCSKLKDYKPMVDIEEGKIFNATIVDSSCRMKGSSSCCNHYGCYVSVKFRNVVYTHQYIEFEEDTCDQSPACNLPLFNEGEYALKEKVARLQKIDGQFEFIDLKIKKLNNRGNQSQYTS